MYDILINELTYVYVSACIRTLDLPDPKNVNDIDAYACTGPDSFSTLFCDDTVTNPKNFLRVFARFLSPDPFNTVKMFDFLFRIKNEDRALDKLPVAKDGSLEGTDKTFDVSLLLHIYLC